MDGESVVPPPHPTPRFTVAYKAQVSVSAMLTPFTNQN